MNPIGRRTFRAKDRSDGLSAEHVLDPQGTVYLQDNEGHEVTIYPEQVRELAIWLAEVCQRNREMGVDP